LASGNQPRTKVLEAVVGGSAVDNVSHRPQVPPVRARENVVETLAKPFDGIRGQLHEAALERFEEPLLVVSGLFPGLVDELPESLFLHHLN